MTVVAVFAALCSLLLVWWIALAVARAPASRADRACSACFAALAVTSVLTFRLLVVEASATRGPLPFFVFLGAPIGLYLAFLAWRLARERERTR
ncbi:MAG TPA: hypothetical protein VK081_08610 [Planctomycetota bacterium]|nr:hypothetical protein [Planctomycetota bacterium]